MQRPTSPPPSQVPKAVLLGLCGCGLGVFAVFCALIVFDRQQVAADKQRLDAAPLLAARGVEAVARAERGAPPRGSSSGSDLLRLPNGSVVASLNGVSSPPPLRWPSDRAWSPIRRRIVDRRGTEWYEHDDGSYSTTLLVDRSDLGRREAVTHVVHPDSPAPVGEGLARPGAGR